MKSHLPRATSCLRRVLGGSANAWTRARIRRTLDIEARCPNPTPEKIITRVRQQHGKRLMEPEYEQLRLALELDLSAPARGGAA